MHKDPQECNRREEGGKGAERMAGKKLTHTYEARAEENWNES